VHRSSRFKQTYNADRVKCACCHTESSLRDKQNLQLNRNFTSLPSKCMCLTQPGRIRTIGGVRLNKTPHVLRLKSYWNEIELIRAREASYVWNVLPNSTNGRKGQSVRLRRKSWHALDFLGSGLSNCNENNKHRNRVFDLQDHTAPRKTLNIIPSYTPSFSSFYSLGQPSAFFPLLLFSPLQLACAWFGQPPFGGFADRR